MDFARESFERRNKVHYDFLDDIPKTKISGIVFIYDWQSRTYIQDPSKEVVFTSRHWLQKIDLVGCLS